VIRVLVYADVDLNLVDGSSVWLVSLAEMLADSGEVDVTILRRTRPQRAVITTTIDEHAHVAMIDPWEEARRDRAVASIVETNSGSRIHNATAARLIRVLDERDAYDVILVRGVEIAAIVAGHQDLADRLWVYLADPLRVRRAGDVPALVRLYGRAKRFLCQTEEAAAAVRSHVGGEPDGKIVLLPPMVPGISTDSRQLEGPPRLGYAGKFSPGYRILETLDAFELIRRERPDAELHVVGDKVHNVPRREGFAEEVTRRLRGTSGVVWHGALDRAEMSAVLGRVHVASSWRDATFDDSVEISTKVLEYASLGLPVLLNPTAIQRRLLGEDYPGFVDSAESFARAFLELTTSEHHYAHLSSRVLQAAEPYTFEAVRSRILPVLRQDAERPSPKRRRRLLFAGHDFKFVRPLVEHFERHPDYRVLTDRYAGHVITDERRSTELLHQADVVFCEWALGNAEWYSHHKLPGQTLVVRLHRQELTVPFLDRIDWDAIDLVCMIAPETRNAFLERFPRLAAKTRLIYNLVNVDAFDVPKAPGAAHTLGLVGMAPALKRPHLALEILELLRAEDQRYTLRIKGRDPREYDWLWRRPEERAYYEPLLSRLDEAVATGGVVLDPHGEDVPDWFTNVGFVLSTSDLEGSHQAVAEGMAAGAIPVIRNWRGADALYPQRFVFRTVDEAVERVRRYADESVRGEEAERCRAFARREFDAPRIASRFDRLLARTAA
jgi:glycosyltransferase involved in cell wall biosynthesis